MHRSILTCSLALALCLGLTGRAAADPMVIDLEDFSGDLGLDLSGLTFPALLTYTQVQWGDDLLAPENTFSDEGVASSSTTNGFTNSESFEGEATANAATDQLGVSASAVATDSPFLVNAASGFAVFTDTITINNGTPGDAGSTTFSFDVTGSTTMSGDAGVVASLFAVTTDQFGTSLLDGLFSFDQDNFSFETSEFPIVFGEAFNLTVIFGVTGQVTGNILSGTGTAIGAFSDTVTLTDINTFDEGGSPTDSTIVRASAMLVPEPESLALFCIGISLLGLYSIRRKRGLAHFSGGKMVP